MDKLVYYNFIIILKQIELYKKKQKRFSKIKIVNFLLTSVAVYSKLQEKQIAHSDIKPENNLILDINNFDLKICDIGSCVYNEQKTNGVFF